MNNEETTYYHGTSIPLMVGDCIIPPIETNVLSEKHRRKNLDMVFFTKDINSAKVYAGRAKNSLNMNSTYVYKVVPEGDVICINDNIGTTVYCARRALIIEIAIADE